MKTMVFIIIAGISALLLVSAACTKPGNDNSDLNMSYDSSGVKLEGRLLAHWQYDEFDTIARDKSGNGFNGVIHGDPVHYEGFSQGFNFDGKDDYLSIPGNQDPPPEEISSLETGSVSLWFNVDSIPLVDGIMPIFFFGSSDNCLNMFDASNQGIIIEVGHSPVHRQSKRLYFTLFMNGCSLPSLCYDTDFDLDEGSWYHFVAVVGDNYNTGYLNGRELKGRHYNFGNPSTSEFFADAPAKEALYIGKGYWDQRTVYFKGQIDDIRIYDKDLNDDEVRYLFSKRAPGSESL